MKQKEHSFETYEYLFDRKTNGIYRMLLPQQLEEKEGKLDLSCWRVGLSSVTLSTAAELKMTSILQTQGTELPTSEPFSSTSQAKEVIVLLFISVF